MIELLKMNGSMITTCTRNKVANNDKQERTGVQVVLDFWLISSANQYSVTFRVISE